MKKKNIFSLLVISIFSCSFLNAGTVETVTNAEVKSFGLNVRTSPKVTNNNRLYELKRGTKVTVYSKTGNWCNISKNKKRFVSCKYLITTSIEEIEIQKEEIKVKPSANAVSTERVGLMNVILKLIDEVNFLKDKVNSLEEKVNTLEKKNESKT